MLDFPRGTKVRSGFLHRRRRLAKRRRLRRQLWLEPLEDRRLLSGGPDLVLGQVLPLGAYPTTAVMADLNGDGRAELLAGSTDFSSQHAVSVYQCVPSGQLQLSATLVPPASPGALASGDFNHDDRADIVVGSYSTGTVSVFLQQSDGSFGPPTTYSATRDIETVAVADVNGDGQPDLVVGGADHITILAGRADGTFWPANASGIPGGFMGTFVLGDLNDDGLPDLVAENPAAMTLGVLLGQGDGTFREQSAIYSAGSLLAIGDVTGDGRPDLVASGSEVGGEQLLVAVGQAGGRFSDFRGQGFLQGFAGAGLADFNRDGRAEIVARTLAVRSLDSAAQRSSHNIDNTLTILGFQSDGTFVSQGVYHLGDQSTPYGGPPALGDLNGDGLPEVAVTNMEARGLLLLDRGRPSQPPGARVVQSVGNSGTSGPLELSGSRQRFVFDRAMSPTPPPVIPLLRLSPPPSLAVGEAAGEAPADYFQWHSEWIDANTLDVYCDVLPGAPLGNYDWEITLGPDLLDAAGAPLNQDGDAVPGEATEDGYTVTARVTVAGPRVRFQTPSVWDGLARPIDALTLSFDFNMDPATFSLDDITSFTGPNGAIVDYDYAWTSPSELRLSFPPQTAFGSYQLILSPEIQDFQGRRLDQNRNKLPGEVPGDQYTAAFTLRPPRLSSGWVFPAWNTIWPVSTAEITFDRPIDPASFSLADDLQLTGPEGSLAVSAFRWNGARLQVWFPPQTGAGTYTLTCGPHLADLAGDELDLDGDGIMGETPDDQALAPFTIFADKPYVTAQSPSGVTAGPVSALHMSFDQAMDQTSFAPADDLVSFAGPAGEVSVTGFRWVNERRLELQFAPQSTPGDYHLVLGTSILSAKGWALDTDRDRISGESHDQYTGSFTIPLAPRVTRQTPSGDVSGLVAALQLTFSRAMDATTFAIADDVLSFTGPAGPLAVSGHTWLNETTLELSFASQAAPGLYQLTLGPDVRDLYGLALDQDADHVPGESPDDQYHATFGIAQPPRVLQSRPAGTVGGPVTAVQFDFSVAMDPQSFAWNDDLVSFTGPAGTPAVTDFRWLDGDTLELSFAQQITPGLYQLVLGPSILSTGGIPLDQDGDLIAGETPDDRYAANFEILAGPRVLSHQPSGDQMQPVSAVTLTFSEAISAATFTAADVRLESPAGLVGVSVRRASDTEFVLEFPQQTAYGTYHVYVGPNLESVRGMLLDQDRDGILGEATDDRYDAAFTLLDATGPRITGATPRLPLRGPLDHLDVTFSEAIDAASFTLADVTAAGPAGLLTPTRLDQLDPRTFRLVFPAQSAEGLYRFTFGPGVQDLVGNWMDQDQDGQKAEPHDQYPATVAIDLTGPRATGHSLAGVQHVAVRSFEVTFNEDLAAATFTPNLVTVTGPEGSRQATLITALAGNRFCVTIPPTAADGTYHVSLAPALTDVAGNLLDQDADRIGGEIPDDRYAFDFEQQLADLVVTGSVVPLEAQPGQPIDIQWTVTNLGRGAATGTWTDLLFLSADGQPGNDVELARLSFSQLLGPGESYVRIATVNVPADVRGDQWVVIQTNGLSELDETETGNNGRVASPPLYVTTRPYPDLRVTSVQTPVTLSAGESAAITWTVLNGGRGATTSPRWFDAIYLSADAVFDAADTKLAEVPNPDFLGSGESYSQTVQIPIPNTTPHGDYYVLVVTDARNQVQEFDGEQNNAAASATTAAVIAPLPAFLTVTNILVSGPLAPGGEPTFTWTVTNTGGTTITTGWNFDRSWDDGLALSRDPVYQADQDYWLGSHTFFWDLPLRPGQSYTLTGATEQAVPAWEPGDYYLMVLPDTHWGADAGFGQSTVGRSYGTALVRLEYALPDLVPASLDVPATGLVGQPLTVGWRIENRGTGDTWGVTWNDHVYLSADNVLDEHDRLLGFRPNPGLVYAGGSYDVSTAWTLPGDLLPGSYYVLLKTDVGETVPESDETNNLRVSAAPVTVQRSVSDLQVTAAQGPAAGVAGETIAVAWSVLNGGLDATAVGQWTDAVYLSPSPALDPATATCLQEFAHTGGLAAQGTYDRSETVTLPSRIAGTSYLFVVLDARQELFELGGENNNVQPLGPSIAVADLAPDLAAESFTAPANAVAGQTLDLNWSVRNVGTRDAAPNWWDAVYLSSDDTWDPQCDTLLGKVERTAALAVGDPYGPAGGGVQVTVPDRIDGTYFLFLVTDVDRQLYEQGRLANNIARQSVAIVDQAPDLRVQSVTTPAGGVAGEVINLSYRVSNGGTEVATERWKDAVYLSADTQFDPAADKLFGAFDAAGPLAVGDAYGPNAAGPVRARLPERLEGTYYIFLVTDYRDAVYEHFGEANNFLLSPTPIHISLQAPDLQVTLVRAPLQARAGETLTVDWAVVNGGLQATAETHWQDGVYLSTDTDFTPAADLELGLADHDGTLAAGAGYTSRATFTLRQDLEGPYYVYVVTDARRQVFEHLAEDNNTLAARQTVAVAGVHADLQVSELQAPPTGVAGGSLRLAWKVINAGRDATPAGSWSDAVYLSADAVLDDGDRELASFRHDRPVAAGGFYWQDETVGLPDGLTGSFYLIVKTDTGRGGGEVDEFQAEDNNTAAAPIACSLPPPVDLRVTEVRPAATAWSGQDVQVGWTVANLGGAAAESPAGGWYDSVFLSRDPYLDRDTDLRLGSFLVPGSLAASGDSYAPAITARLPAGISGPYYVLVWTDSNDRVAERGGEDNNVWASVTPLQVNLTPPADLQVTQVAPPATGTLGQPAEWQYRVANLATDEAAYGAWYDTLYLSADEQWDLGDPRIARVYHQGDVPAAGFYEQTVTANVPGVQPGDYYVIVRTDILNDVREQDETNNTTVSAEQVSVEAQELVFEQPAAGTLADQQSAYYRLWADSGDDVVVTLSGAAAPGATVYLTYEGVPTRTLYDLKSTLVAGTPQLRLPSAPAGTYYLLVYRDLPGAARTYQLTARQLPFGVTDVTPNHGGNVGDVTLLVSGSLLPAQPLARLISPQGEAVYGHRIYPGDGTNFFATFALSGLAVGVYDVEAAGPDGVWAAALDAFTVQAGTGANLQARLILNDLVRANAATTIIVEYENTGDIDLASPLLQIQGPDNLPFGLAPDRLDYAGAIQFLAPSYTGPAGILRPGERQRLTLHSVAAATGAAEYTLTSQSVNPLQPSTLLIDWDALREQYRPPFTADDEAWRATWRIFTQQIGATWDEVILTLADRVTGLGLSHVDSLVVDELLQEQFRQSLSRGGGLTDEAPPWIVGHTPVPAAAGGVGAVDVDFSEDLDPATFTADDVNITDPVGQAVLATAIIPLTSRTYRLEFPVQTTPGQYTVVVGPQIADLTGRELDQDHDGASGETNDDRYRASFGLGGPDATAEEYPLFVTGHTPVDPVSQTDGLTQFTVTFSQPILRYQLAPQDVILTGPDGAVPGLSVQRLSAQQYQLAFPPQNVLGDYTLTVAPAILGGPPVRVAAARTAVAGEAGNAYVGQAQVVDREAPRIVSSSPDNLQPSAVSKITVTFNEPIKPGSFGTSSVELRDPAGNLVIVTGVVRKSDTAFEITFPEQSVAGIYRLEIGEDVSSRAAEDLSGNKMSSFFGYFGIIDGLVVRGKIQYGGELLRYFGDNARVRVQLWEAKGQPDAIPGTPVTAGDTPDVLLSNRNDLATESSLWGDDLVSNLTTETGEFVFTRDDSGEYLGNTNPPRQIYLVVYAANEYAYVREENSLRINSDGSHAGDPAWVAGAQWSGRTLLWYLRHHDPTPAPVTLQAGTQRQVVDLSRTITDDQFGLSAWVRVAAKAMADKTGATSRTPIAIAFPDDNYGAGNAVHYPDPNNERIGIGTKMVTSPATVLHEYGHALEFAANNYKDFPYGVSGAGSSYGIIDESLDASGAPLLTKAFAEGWASFVAAKVLEGRQVVVAAPGQPAATGINVAGAWFDQNRSGQFLDNNDFWMGYDAFGYTVGQDRNRNGIPDYRDSDVRATNLAARFAADGINDNGNMGANVLGAVETILWHLAGRADGDGLNDLPGVWTALKAAAQGEGILYRQRLSGQARPQDFYRAYIELPGVDKAKVDKIFIDNGVPVADDIYEDNNTEATAADLGVLHGPWSQDGLIVAEAKTGDADWFRFTLPATETDPSQRRQYDTSITLDFDPKYGDLDVVVVNLTTGGRRSNLARGGGSETFRDSLWNDTQYQFLVGIGGHGVFDATGNIANPIRGGDYNPSYKLSITFALPAPAVQAAQQPQSVAVQNIAGSHDPNDKLGPTGFGAERYLSADAVWPYTVRFENDLRATAPAVLVTIRDQLDVNLDWTTFELGDIQFGEHTLSVPPGLTSYHPEPFDLRPFGNNLLVDIDARLDKATGLVQWTLTGLDPATGEMSQDPTAGFLPPNDVATHSGEGEVHYTIRSQTGLPGGTAISNLATIVFDWNEPIDTPTVVNWIDSGAPSGGVGPLPSTASELIFPVAWDATDEAGGAGVHAFDVYVSDNGGPFEPWLQDTANRTGLFVGQPNHTYAFYSQATDHAGHRESVPAVADAVTTVQLVSWQNRRSPYDVDDNGWVHPLDALRLINAINGGLRDLPQPAAPPSYWDVNDDGILTALDVLFVINVLNSGKQPAGEGEPAASGSWPTLPAASQFGGFLMPPASRNPSGPDFQSGQDGWEKRPTQGASSTPPETRPSSAAGRPAAGARRDPSPPRATVFELGDWNQPLEDALDDLFRAATQASPA